MVEGGALAQRLQGALRDDAKDAEGRLRLMLHAAPAKEGQGRRLSFARAGKAATQGELLAEATISLAELLEGGRDTRGVKLKMHKPAAKGGVLSRGKASVATPVEVATLTVSVTAFDLLRELERTAAAAAPAAAPAAARSRSSSPTAAKRTRRREAESEAAEAEAESEASAPAAAPSESGVGRRRRAAANQATESVGVKLTHLEITAAAAKYQSVQVRDRPHNTRTTPGHPPPSPPASFAPPPPPTPPPPPPPPRDAMGAREPGCATAHPPHCVVASQVLVDMLDIETGPLPGSASKALKDGEVRRLDFEKEYDASEGSSLRKAISKAFESEEESDSEIQFVVRAVEAQGGKEVEVGMAALSLERLLDEKKDHSGVLRVLDSKDKEVGKLTCEVSALAALQQIDGGGKEQQASARKGAASPAAERARAAEERAEAERSRGTPKARQEAEDSAEGRRRRRGGAAEPTPASRSSSEGASATAPLEVSATKFTPHKSVKLKRGEVLSLSVDVLGAATFKTKPTEAKKGEYAFELREEQTADAGSELPPNPNPNPNPYPYPTPTPHPNPHPNPNPNPNPNANANPSQAASWPSRSTRSCARRRARRSTSSSRWPCATRRALCCASSARRTCRSTACSPPAATSRSGRGWSRASTATRWAA